MVKELVTTGLLVAALASSRAQSERVEFPRIGQPMPAFTLQEVEGWKHGPVTLDDLKGKPLVLDFWNKYCTACIKSFPKVSALHNRFKDQLNIIVVGLDEPGIRPLYERMKNKYDLDFPAAFDAELYHRFVHAGAPQLVWIDSEGIVRAVTTSTEFNAENVEAFIRGEAFEFLDMSYYNREDRQMDYDPKIPFLVDGNGGTGIPILSRSLLVEYKPNEMPYRGFTLSTEAAVRHGRVEGAISLEGLYRFAYTGYCTWAWGYPIYETHYHTPILELDDPNVFLADTHTGKNMYWYSLIVPEEKLSEEHLKRVMQDDLAHNFGYEARIETRVMPYWKVIASDEARKKLKTKGGEPVYEADHTGCRYMNVPIGKFFKWLFYNHATTMPPILDETGITTNIDMEIEVFTADFEDIKKALRKKGLMLVRGKKKFNVLVIGEPNRNSE